ncbi:MULTISPECIES: ABC transporter ATP-binding protein [unclassified Haladaptatus]|uniref:ABC transporter ATP-binding protein n=1 Tax=unclassified Haladaptatus TaxID=2622732 RepID=UPI00209C34F8|nr:MULTISPECIES: ABC transporter ATP-binding protein [unclassified Haladaptatus]MCO8243956.1 ABC transporter ATP-binding protein [Haladaptatus sp. AB643]MCO8256491.1 ABC transporter ATP-binding protein [Haladaptatus sp. AB618]
MDSAIRIRDLEKEYGEVRALKGIDLDVPKGSFFGLLGPNGAGKTTFINILVGLVKNSGGTAEVFGADVEDDYREARDRIGLAPQEFNVDRFFPIREVLEHKAGYHGIPRSEAGERADEVLRRVGIYDKRDTRFDWLSGGMKRRFVLARALITKPDLLILDEPTAGVDVQLRHDLWDLITELNESGTTILLTTHYIEEAERLCDEVAILDSGRIVEVASPEELMGRGPDKITISLRNPPESAPQLSAGRDKIEEVELSGDELVITAPEAGLLAPELVRELDRKGFEIIHFDISRTSLEEVFVEMTRANESTSDGNEGAGDGDGKTDDFDRDDSELAAIVGGDDA